jgi:hypothetical protein
VLPAPQKVHGGQRGLSSRWSLQAPAQAAWVKAKLDRGFTFEEIAAALTAGEFKPAPSSGDGHKTP